MLYKDYQPGAKVVGNNVNFKYDLDWQDNEVGFTSVRLVSTAATTTYHSVEKANITKIKLTPSLDDPWAELKVLLPLGAVYFKSDCLMVPPKTLVRLDDQAYAPYLFARWDSTVLGYVYRDFRVTR